jgi:hypothetical protein
MNAGIDFSARAALTLISQRYGSHAPLPKGTVQIPGKDARRAVPLSQLDAINPNESTEKKAIRDCRYWVLQGYLL